MGVEHSLQYLTQLNIIITLQFSAVKDFLLSYIFYQKIKFEKSVSKSVSKLSLHYVNKKACQG